MAFVLAAERLHAALDSSFATEKNLDAQMLRLHVGVLLLTLLNWPSRSTYDAPVVKDSPL